MKVTFDKLGGIKELVTDHDQKNWIKKGYSAGLPYGAYKVQLIADAPNAVKCVYLSGGLNVEVVRRVYENEVKETYKIHNPYSNIVSVKEYQMGIEFPFITKYEKKKLQTHVHIQGAGSWFAVTEEDGCGMAVLCVKGDVGSYALSSSRSIGAFSFLFNDFDMGYDGCEEAKFVYFPIASLRDVEKKAKEYGVAIENILPALSFEAGEYFHLNIEGEGELETDLGWQKITRQSALRFDKPGEKILRLKYRGNVFEFYAYCRSCAKEIFYRALAKENELFCKRFEMDSEKKFMKKHEEEFELFLACLCAYRERYHDDAFESVFQEAAALLKKSSQKSHAYDFLRAVTGEEVNGASDTPYAVLYPAERLRFSLEEDAPFMDQTIVKLKKGEALSSKQEAFVHDCIDYNRGLTDYRALGFNNGLREQLSFDRIKAGLLLALYGHARAHSEALSLAREIVFGALSLAEEDLFAGYSAPAFSGRKNGLEKIKGKNRFACLYLLLECMQWIK